MPSFSVGPNEVADFDIEGYDVSLGYIGQRGEVSVKYANIESKKDGEPATSFDGNYFTAPLGEIITISGAFRMPTLALELGMSTEITLDNDALEAAGNKQEGYTVVDLYADYQATRNLSLRLSVDNVGDEDYTDRASYGQEFATVDTLLEPGRSFALSARYGF